MPLHVVLLTNIISPHQHPLYLELSRRLRRFTILVSTPMEPDRWSYWQPAWESLEVRVQRTTTFERPWRHPAGFTDSIFVHIPWDTVGMLRRLRPDLIISSELGGRSLLSALYKRTARRVPLILWTALSEHTEQGRGRARNWLRKWLVGQADGLIVNGRSGERYMRRMGFRSPHVFHIPYAALPATFDRNPPTRHGAAAHRLLYVGRLNERKGVLPFTRALVRWAAAHPQRQVEFVLAGDGPLRAQIERLGRPPNLTLRLLGICDYRQIAASYAAAGILVLPTLADEWGLVVNEGMAAGLPVLGSRYAQAVEELCVDGVTGWTFRPDCAEEMQQALDQAMSTSVEQLNQMRLAARACVAPLRPENNARRVLHAIQTVYEARSRASGRPAVDCDRGGNGRPKFPRELARLSGWNTLGGSTKNLGIRAAGHVGTVLAGWLGSRGRQSLGILTYHRVGTPPPGVPQPADCVTPDQFREHVLGLLERGFQVWPLGKVLQHRAAGLPLASRTVVLSFDDGYAGVYAFAFPVLKQLQVPATVFVCTGYLDQHGPLPFDAWAMAHRHRLPAELYRPLRTAECAEMASSGLVDLGVHTHLHEDYRRRPRAFRESLQRSIEVLQSQFQVRRFVFAYPYGNSALGFAGEELAEIARQSGMLCGLTNDPRLVDPQSDPFAWGRFTAFSWDCSATLAAKLGGWYSWAPRLYRSVVRVVDGVSAGK